MSFEEGFRLTDTEKLKENDINSRQVAASACALFAELMMVHGFVHADAHPGEIRHANQTRIRDVTTLR